MVAGTGIGTEAEVGKEGEVEAETGSVGGVEAPAETGKSLRSSGSCWQRRRWPKDQNCSEFIPGRFRISLILDASWR